MEALKRLSSCAAPEFRLLQGCQISGKFQPDFRYILARVQVNFSKNIGTFQPDFRLISARLQVNFCQISG